jgi:hypothetical protein
MGAHHVSLHRRTVHEFILLPLRHPQKILIHRRQFVSRAAIRFTMLRRREMKRINLSGGRHFVQKKGIRFIRFTTAHSFHDGGRVKR